MEDDFQSLSKVSESCHVLREAGGANNQGVFVVPFRPATVAGEGFCRSRYDGSSGGWTSSCSQIPRS